MSMGPERGYHSPREETDMVSDSLVREFQRLLGKEQVFLQETDRLPYAYDAAVLEPVLPALGFGGTLSGAHGLGLAKARFMENEVGRGTILYAKRIKAALDPKKSLNPGKSIGE
jgi:hypothetical protein